MKSKKLVNDLKNKPYEIGLTLPIKLLEEILIEASDSYYNKIEFIDDYTFDVLKEILEQRDPNNKFLSLIGAPILQTEKKVKLPIWMGSMDKVKPNSSELSKWLLKYNKNYLISEKLDGLSGLLEIKCSEGKLSSILYSRGNGQYGQDISKLLKYLNLGKINYELLNKLLKKNEKILLRGEIIIKKNTFIKKYSDKYPKARSFVAGIVNSKNIDSNLAKDLDLVIYELVSPWSNYSEQFKLIKELGFNLVNFIKYDKLDSNKLKELLLNFKSNSKYDIDGIIISSTDKIVRNNSGNPKYSVAFKMLLNEQIETTKVEYVEYNISKHGLLIPRVRFNPITIGGDTIMFTTGFNIKYIIDNKIGKGTILQIVRSGDVIPYIYKIIKSSSAPDLPNVEWKWNNTKIHAVVNKIDSNPDVIFKRIVNFFKILEIEGLGPGIIRKLIDAGYDSVLKILKLTPTLIASIDGFQLKSANNLVNNIKKVIDKPINLNKLMAASNVFGTGMGEKKLKPVIETYPNLIELYNKNKLTLDEIKKIEGFSDKTAGQFISALPLFINWLSVHNLLKINKSSSTTNTNSTNKPLAGNVYVFTGIRDNELERHIEDKGGKIGTQVNSNTTTLIVKDVNTNSSKILKAKQLNITIINIETAREQLI